MTGNQSQTNQTQAPGTPAPQPTVPPGHIPQHRFDEVLTRTKRLEEENARLRQHVDSLAYQQQVSNQPKPANDSPFEENVRTAMQKEFDNYLKPKADLFQRQVGQLVDENDYLKFSIRYGAENYNTYQDKIEQLRDSRARQGQYMSREDAYKFIKFEENGVKAKENPIPAQPEIKYDRYGQPINQPPQTQPDVNQVANQMAAQDRNYNPQTQQPAQPYQQPGQPPYVPQNYNNPGVQPNLPPQGITSGDAPPRQPADPMVSMDAKEQDLDAWAERYANKPL